MIGLSPLATAHPNLFQQVLVRASTTHYRRFTLAMASSLRFGSAPRNFGRPIRTRFRYGFGPKALNLTLRRSNSPDHYAKGTPSHGPTEIGHRASTDCRHTVSGTISLPLKGCFSPFPHGTGSLSVVGEFLALEGGPPRFSLDYSCPGLLRNRSSGFGFSPTGLSPSVARLSSTFRLTLTLPYDRPTTPRTPKGTRFGLTPVRSHY